MHLSNSGSFSCPPPPPWPKSGLGTCFFEFLILELVYLPIFIRIARDLPRKSEVVFNFFFRDFFWTGHQGKVEWFLNDPKIIEWSILRLRGASLGVIRALPPPNPFFVRNLWGWSWLKLFLLFHFLGIRLSDLAFSGKNFALPETLFFLIFLTFLLFTLYFFRFFLSFFYLRIFVDNFLIVLLR